MESERNNRKNEPEAGCSEMEERLPKIIYTFFLKTKQKEKTVIVLQLLITSFYSFSSTLLFLSCSYSPFLCHLVQTFFLKLFQQLGQAFLLLLHLWRFQEQLRVQLWQEGGLTKSLFSAFRQARLCTVISQCHLSTVFSKLIIPRTLQ